jgi:hypothetical protein
LCGIQVLDVQIVLRNPFVLGYWKLSNILFLADEGDSWDSRSLVLRTIESLDLDEKRRLLVGYLTVYIDETKL